ncbi:MAG: hypothetical protein CK539_02260 [Flavobacteriales bacterium]|nr:MAG: hypothetical protein CK539_02260 [Flavobacteriales bacterium]
MKKGLLIILGISASIALSAQVPKIAGVKKIDLTNSNAKSTDGESRNFYNTATSNQRSAGPNTIQSPGVKFSSSWNAFTLLVSSSHCLTADQALNAVMFTHRISQDWPADANVASGYGEYSWTTNFGTTWDSSYFADQTSLGNKRFRYPSGAIINPAGNTNVANALNVATGPYTSGSNWDGYYGNNQMMVNGAGSNTSIFDNGVGTPALAFPRISITSYDDSSAWVSGGFYTDPIAATGYLGSNLMKGKWNGTALTWSFDSILPYFHQDGTGANDAFTQSFVGFSPNGQIGYQVFFGVDGSATTSQTRAFSPITYKSTNGGATWNLLPVNDFSTIPAISTYLIPASDGNLKPWFDQSQGADIVVDNNGELHIVCTISSGSSDDNDSLGYSWTLTGQNGTTAKHYIYDVHTSPTGWDAWLIDSLMTSTSTNNTIFLDGSTGNAFATDARIQMSHTTDRSKLFFAWVDSDPLALAGENALPDLKAVGFDLVTGFKTPVTQFTTSQDFYFHYVSNVTLVSGNTYSIGVTNSIDRNGSHDVITTFDHYFYEGCKFNTSDFTVQFVGVNEQAANFGSLNIYPNPAKDQINLNVNMVSGENVSFQITNSLGQVVLVENRSLVNGNNNVQLNTSKLTSGVYFVTIASETSKVTSKIVIQ